MRGRARKAGAVISAILVSLLVFLGALYAQESAKRSSYSPVVITEEFTAIMARMKAAMPGVMKRQKWPM